MKLQNIKTLLSEKFLKITLENRQKIDQVIRLLAKGVEEPLYVSAFFSVPKLIFLFRFYLSFLSEIISRIALLSLLKFYQNTRMNL